MPRIFCDIDDTIIRDGEVFQPVVDFLEEEAEEVVFLTNRPETERERTVADLERTGVEYERLIMNPGEEPAPEFKARVIKEEYLDKGLRADGLIDNREDTRNAVERLGVRALSPEEVAAYMEAEDMEEDDVEEEDDMQEQEDSVAASRKVMTPEELVDSLKAEASALVTERDDLRATVEKLTVGAAAEAEALKVEAAAKDARINELSAALEAADKLVSDLSQKVAALEGNAITASAEAAKIAASVGVEPVEQTPADKPVATADDIKAQFLAMPFGKERTAFFNKHRSVILSK